MRPPSRRSAFAAGGSPTAHILPPAELDALPIDATRWRERFEAPPAGWTTFVAERDALVGFAAVGPSRDEQGLGELYAIYVEPAPGRGRRPRADRARRGAAGRTYPRRRSGC